MIGFFSFFFFFFYWSSLTIKLKEKKLAFLLLLLSYLRVSKHLVRFYLIFLCSVFTFHWTLTNFFKESYFCRIFLKNLFIIALSLSLLLVCLRLFWSTLKVLNITFLFKILWFIIVILQEQLKQWEVSDMNQLAPTRRDQSKVKFQVSHLFKKLKKKYWLSFYSRQNLMWYFF